MDVAAWLGELGLAQYAQAFRNNDVDEQTLRLLTERDLADIGVKSIGHRRRLMSAIARLDSEPQRQVDVRAAPPEEGELRPQAERRQLSVLYCDMVGSTALSVRLDPEDMREVIRVVPARRARAPCRATTATSPTSSATACSPTSAGRARTRTMPSARCAPGWRWCEAVGALSVPAGRAAAVRVGIATGAVVVGDLVHEGPAQEQSAVGETPNLAARLQALAAPGQVVVDEATQRLLAASYRDAVAGQHALKGVGASRCRLSRVVGERAADSRFEARAGPDADADGRARSGAGAAAGALGAGQGRRGPGRDAGRRGGHRQVAHRPRAARCVRGRAAHARALAVLAVPQRQRAVAGDPAAERAPGCRPTTATTPRWTSCSGSSARTTRPCGCWPPCSASTAARATAPCEMTPQLQRVRTLEVLVEQLLACAQRQPLLLVVEDAHWIDPTHARARSSTAWTGSTHARVLMLVTSRPDNQPALGAHPQRHPADAEPPGPRRRRGDRRAARRPSGCKRRRWRRSWRRPTACRCSSRS